MSSPRLDTSCSVIAVKGVRSPRTPIYRPDSPSTISTSPFDPTKYFPESGLREADRRTPPPPPPPQQQPVPWIWICHLCHSRYPLGVTRRCLVDGHYYCSGQTDQQSLRKKKKPRACSSEFDYAAWRNWGAWRRAIPKILQDERDSRGCEYCDFPSQCRYPANSHPLANVQATLIFPEAQARGPLADLGQTAEARGKDEGRSKANENVDFDQILENIYTDTLSQAFRSQKSVNAKQQKGDVSRGEKKRLDNESTRLLNEELTQEEKRLRELIGPDLWSCLQEIGLHEAPTE